MSVVWHCPSCSEPMTVEEPGGVVECPHCSAPVSADNASTGVSALDDDGGSALDDDDDGDPRSSDSFANLAAIQAAAAEIGAEPFVPPSRTPETPPVEGVEDVVESAPQPEGDDPTVPGSEPPPTIDEFPVTPPEPTSEQMADTGKWAPPGDQETIELPATTFADLPSDAEPPAPVPSRRPAASTVPRSWFVLAVSYGSVVTLLLLGLVLDVISGGLIVRALAPPHALESLPDVLAASDLKLVPADAPLPPGHVLHIGESRRYGCVELEITGVTREPVSKELRNPLGDITTVVHTEPVLVLHLRARNVAEDRPVRPFDRVLLFANGRTSTTSAWRSNQFVRRLDASSAEECVPPLPLEDDGSWAFVGERFDHEIAPGESYDFYIPTIEDVDRLTGELVWRVQFRKGYGPNSGRGVTTLVDVRFHSDEVEVVNRPDA